MPVHLHTIGDHIRKKRLASGLLQSDVAKILDVCEDTITGWENGRNMPQLCNYPSIIEFLGYYPFPHEADTIAGKLLQLRYSKGLSFKACGALFGFNASTIRAWEKGTSIPKVTAQLAIKAVWQQLPFTTQTNES